MKKEPKYIKKAPDFMNLTGELDKKYFPDIKFYIDHKKGIQFHYAVECFNNGVLTYTKLIKKLAKSCNDTEGNIHAIVSKYIQDWGDFKPNFK